MLAGTHLIAHSCYRTIDRGGQFVLLGSAPDPRIQAEFDELKNQVGPGGPGTALEAVWAADRLWTSMHVAT